MNAEQWIEATEKKHNAKDTLFFWTATTVQYLDNRLPREGINDYFVWNYVLIVVYHRWNFFLSFIAEFIL